VNQGKRHSLSFYTQANLRRLWNQVRAGGRAQSCHLTDPSHPDHVIAGAKPDATARECPGSIILIKREIKKMADVNNVITVEATKHYLATNKRGITKTGIVYWVIQRMQLAGVPFMGGQPMPEVDVDDPAIGLPQSIGGAP
jgi:TusA-related sulfurtransferase